MSIYILPIIVIYALASTLLLIYGINAYVLIYYSIKSWKDWKRSCKDLASYDVIPRVTIQLPIYNERNVAARVIHAAAKLQYPRDKLEIQVLDDSNDETREIIDKTAGELSRAGIDVNVLRRADRKGYKAGALAEGTKTAKGEYLAVFDADFVPEPDFLLKAMPPFLEDDKIAFVQARWGHINRDENILTMCQSLGIDGHFLVEQPARAHAGFFMNFNGTAGIWKKEAIEDVGGWSDRTLTEDLDLSYRVQLAGWKPYFMEDVVVPAEVPATMAGAKSQQFRWAKGSIQTAVLMLPKIWRRDYSLLTKMEAALHLTNYGVHPMMLTLAILAYPILQFNLVKMSPYFFAVIALPLIAATLGPSTMYTIATLRNQERKNVSLLWLPFLVIYGTGIAISNSIAVFEAVVGKASSFIRTPKKGSRIQSGYKLNRSKLWLFEISLGLYSFGSISASIMGENYGVLPFLMIFAFGFVTVGIRTFMGIARDA
ncbi:MAG: glycosyltransferase [candidate division Zixibacteria bacterium]|nr:glycosyltransferase [candidate division Zixibacteria bacterium]